MRNRPPNHLALIANGAHIHKSHRIYSKQEAGFNRHTSTPPGYTPGLSTEEQAKTLIISQFLPGRGLTAYFSSCCRRDQFLTSPHLVADWDPPGSLQEPGGSSPSPLVYSNCKTKSPVSPRKELVHIPSTTASEAAT